MKKQIFMHIGLPKTATSAFQSWCNVNKFRLLKNGIDYPDEIELVTLRHQFIIKEIKNGLFNKLQACLSNTNCQKILFSVEGISNQFFTFTEEQLLRFREVLNDYDVTLLLVRRDYDSWIKSYYKQCVVNPLVTGFPYATTLDMEEFKKLQCIQMLNSLPNEPEILKKAFGAKKIVIADYEEDWMSVFGKAIGYADMSIRNLERHHESLNDETIKFILEINRLNLPNEIRNTLLHALQKTIKTNHNAMLRYLNFNITKQNSNIAKEILKNQKIVEIDQQIYKNMLKILNEIK